MQGFWAQKHSQPPVTMKQLQKATCVYSFWRFFSSSNPEMNTEEIWSITEERMVRSVALRFSKFKILHCTAQYWAIEKAFIWADLPWPELSCFVLFWSDLSESQLINHELSCPVLSWSELTSSGLSWPVLICPDVSWTVLIYPNLSWPVLSVLTWP